MIKKIKLLPNLDFLREELSFSKSLKYLKGQRDKEIKSVLESKSEKFLVICGPCSADNIDSVCDYAYKLAKFTEHLKERLLIIPRFYTSKPRSKGRGYFGMTYHPNPAEEANLYEGLISARRMHLKAATESELFAADEMLYPEYFCYVEDLLSYFVIGARSSENQQHRQTASGFDIPCGVKNPMNGHIEAMLNSIEAIQIPQHIFYRGSECLTSGNFFSHGILRGYVNHKGLNKPNFHINDVLFSVSLYLKKNIANPAIIIDASHGNSNKNYSRQPEVVKEILRFRKDCPLLKKSVKGLMLESYIESGSQDIPAKIYGKSITDGCLGLSETILLLNYIYDNI